VEAAGRHDARADRRLHRLPYIDDALTRDEALEILRRNESTKAEREAILLAEGFPAYTTSAGWLGYSEKTLPDRAQDALDAASRISS
jgi:hypothetical protein